MLSTFFVDLLTNQCFIELLTFLHIVLVSVWPPQKKQCRCFLRIGEMMLIDLYHTGIGALNAQAGDWILMQLF
jgi:hypothetical protein